VLRFVGRTGLYGTVYEPDPETRRATPFSVTGSAKWPATLLLKFFARGTAFAGGLSKYSNVLGRDRIRHGEAGVSTFARECCGKQGISRRRAYIRRIRIVGDVARPNQLALEELPEGHGRNIGDGVLPTDVNELADSERTVH